MAVPYHRRSWKDSSHTANPAALDQLKKSLLQRAFNGDL
jgi:hypothetical protein